MIIITKQHYFNIVLQYYYVQQEALAQPSYGLNLARWVNLAVCMCVCSRLTNYIINVLFFVFFCVYLTWRNAMMFRHRVGFYILIIEVVSGLRAHANNCRRVRILFTDKTSNLTSCFEMRPPLHQCCTCYAC